MQNTGWRLCSVKSDVAVSEFRGATPCVLHLAQLLHLALTSLRPRPKAPEKTGALQKLRHFERPRIASVLDCGCPSMSFCRFQAKPDSIRTPPARLTSCFAFLYLLSLSIV